jgi:4-amino-4-deoxy-L-arabinose transferase-like glycosyltransferase
MTTSPVSEPTPAAPAPAEKQPAKPACHPAGRLCVWSIVAVLVVALGLRLGYVLTLPADLRWPDEETYDQIATNFLIGEGLTFRHDEIQKPPLYPLTLAVLTKLGLQAPGVRIVQAFLGALTCLLIYLLARELMGEWPGRVAGALAAVEPFFIYFTGYLLTETLFLLFFVASWYYIVRTWQELSRRARKTEWLARCLIAGLLAAATTLIRPELLPVYALVPIVWLLIGPRRIAGFAVGVLMMVVWCVGMSPWVARNYVVLYQPQETPIVVTTLGVGESLFEGVFPRATGGPAKERSYLYWPAGTERLSEYERNKELIAASVSLMTNNPRRTLELAWVKLKRTWSVVPNDAEAQTPFYRTVSMVYYIPVFAAAVLGLLVALVKRRRELVWTLLPVVLLTLTHMVFVGSVRYRVMMMPLVLVLSGAGICWLGAFIFRRSRPSAEEV